MEGLEISEVQLSSVEEENRFDSEFFRNTFIKANDFIKKKKHFTVGCFFKVTDGEHGSVVLQESGIKYLTAENIKKGYIDISNVRYIDESVDRRNARASVKAGDVLISIKGTLGEVAVAESWLLPANMNRDVAILKPLEQRVSSEYLAIFLMSKYGAFQSLRGGSGGVQQMITLERLRKFVVPEFSSHFYELIQKLYCLSQLQRVESLEAYKRANEALLEELNLVGFTPSNEQVNIKSFSESFDRSGRLDAEYYQPKFDELDNLIKQYALYCKQVSDIRIDNFRGLQPIYVPDGQLDVINSKHILENTLDYENFEKTDIKYWEIQKRAQVYKGDILTYTTGANIGRTQAYYSDNKALASNHVNILRIKEENPYYVAFVINSPVGRMQTDKHSAGSAQAELYPKDIDEFIIPFIGEQKENMIVSKVEESLKLKRQSEAILSIAKRGVEIAIEQDEQAAKAWIKAECDKPGINLKDS